MAKQQFFSNKSHDIWMCKQNFFSDLQNQIFFTVVLSNFPVALPTRVPTFSFRLELCRQAWCTARKYAACSMLIARVLLFIIMRFRIEKVFKLSSQKNFEDDTIDRCDVTQCVFLNFWCCQLWWSKSVLNSPLMGFDFCVLKPGGLFQTITAWFLPSFALGLNYLLKVWMPGWLWMMNDINFCYHPDLNPKP